ncbi:MULTISPECIES: MucR family transcriptional regulator [unclassified Devosia]|jgi:predicted transcriptional regulator|uniref:MucR family transcriptional regulator n=2 Tax=Devosia TaxID=46913 RepID=UPI000FDB981E|nr:MULTISPECIES: MucR family transcriptional regulator [unclassified Devosia]
MNMTEPLTKAQVFQAAATVASGYFAGSPTALAEVGPAFAKILQIVAAAGGPGGNISGLEPAVPFDQSIKRDFIICMVCGKKLRSLKHHLRSLHSLTPEHYRSMWNLPDNYPMVAEELSLVRSDISRKTQADFKAAHGMSLPRAKPPRRRQRSA